MYVHAWGWMNTTDVPNHRRGDRGVRAASTSDGQHGSRGQRVSIAGPARSAQGANVRMSRMSDRIPSAGMQIRQNDRLMGLGRGAGQAQR
jgi:hypothetical protein